MFWNFSDILIRPNEKIYPRQGEKILIEIGFGNGEFLEHLAGKFPNARVVGVEVSQWCVTKAARRALSSGLGNVGILWGDARFLLPRVFGKNSVDGVYMNFPCPWPKRRHTERRVTSPRFAGLMAHCLKRGGRFELATDVDWYAYETKEAFRTDGAFECGEVRKNPERDYLTKYERKWREMGRDTYMTVAEKIRDDDGMSEATCGAENEDVMETACDATPGSIREALLSIKGTEVTGEAFKVMFREVFFAGDDAALIAVISVDEGFEQHYYLKIVRGNGVLRGKVDSVGHPYRTPGVRASLRHVMKEAGVRF